MTGATLGAASGGILAIVGLIFGFWGFLLVAVLATLGALVGALLSGRLDFRAVAEAARGRRSA